MSALNDLLLAAQAAESGREGESAHDIRKGWEGPRDESEPPTAIEAQIDSELLEAPAEYVGTFPDAETGEEVEVYAATGGLLVSADYSEERVISAGPRHMLQLTGTPSPEPLAETHPELQRVTGPTGRAVAIEPEAGNVQAVELSEDVSIAESAPASFEILEMIHSKRRFTYYQVTLADRVEREQFNELRAACILANGWYSRPWAGQPGGFAFREEQAAREFANEHLEGPSGPRGGGSRTTRIETPATPAAAPVVPATRCHANKLNTLADTMQGEIDGKLGDRLENTPKRQGQAAAARLQGYQLQRAQQVMRELATLWEAGQVPAILQDVHSKRRIIELMAAKLEDVPNGFHAYHVEATPAAPRSEEPEALALWALYTADPHAAQAQTLTQALAQVHGRDYPGYFWTEGEAREHVHDAAAVEPYHAVLDPSAGDGSLLVGLPRDSEAITMVVEIQPDLCDVLKLRGFDARPADFLTLPTPAAPLFDRVLMNPPFEKMADVRHVLHAWEFLREGGRLVAVMSPAWTFHDTVGAREFRDWVEELGGEWQLLPAGSFRHAGTTVHTGMLTLRK